MAKQKRKIKPRTFLTEEQIKEIHAKRETGSWSQIALAKEYGVSRSYMHRILNLPVAKNVATRNMFTRRDLMIALNEQSKIIASLEVQLDKAFLKWDKINSKLAKKLRK